MRLLLVFMLFSISLTQMSCGYGKIEDASVPSDTPDLEFSKSKNAQEYADLILRAIKTNRGKVIANQLSKDSLDTKELQHTVHSFGQAINRKGWAMDSAEEKIKDQAKRINYSWYDKKNRETVRISVDVIQNKSFQLNKLNFNSRIEALDSKVY